MHNGRLLAWVAALALLLPVPSCSKSLSELIPFPCASDHSCPGGLACIPGVGCSPAQVDSPCVPSETDCTTATKEAKCELGICTLSCSANLACRAGHVCSSDPSVGSGVCLPDCSDGQICPAGLSCAALAYSGKKGCVGGGGAVENKLDAPCEKDEDCGKPGTQLRCTVGVCSLPCDTGLACADGHVCTSASGPGWCLVDCSTGSKCQAGLACHDLWFEAKKGCMAPSKQLPACKAVLASETYLCIEQCGLYANKFYCSDNTTFCPLASTCEIAKKVCDCDRASSTPLTCAGGPCDASNGFCSKAAWWCKPNTLEQDCNSVSPNLDVVCSCVSGFAVERTCGANVSCNEICKDGCDFTKQNCRDQTTPKCDPNGSTSGTQGCEPLIGQKKAGEACQFGSDPAFPRADDCDKGFKCSVDTSPSAPSGVCRRLCLADSDCSPPEKCLAGPIDGTFGYCLAPCTLFGADCPSGMKCKLSRIDGLLGVCFRPGTQPLGWSCYYDADCKDDLTCWMGSCTAFCDSSHACPALQPAPKCKLFRAPNPTGAGLCLFNQPA